MKYALLLMVAMISLSGCTGILGEDETTTSLKPQTTTTTLEGPTYVELTTVIPPPITVSSIMIPEYTTTILTTTTIHPCSDGVKNYGEAEVDCSRLCGNCEIMNLSGEYIRYRESNFWFKFDGPRATNVTCPGAKGWPRTASYFHYLCPGESYMLALRGTAGRLDYRLLDINDTGYADELMFKILSYDNKSGNLTIYVKEDPAAREILKGSAVLSLGGPRCNTNLTGFCRRWWNNYEFKLTERGSDRAKIDVILPNGKIVEDIEVNTENMTHVEKLRVGLLHAYDKGGYVVIYAI
ncbi:MAG: hypothetical protein V1921_04125 [Candidatus Altiarchaeota archaeon]